MRYAFRTDLGDIPEKMIILDGKIEENACERVWIREWFLSAGLRHVTCE